MENFNLEEAISVWRKSMRQQQGLEPGFIEEIEASLRDRIEDYQDEGKSEEEAYYLAREKSMSDPEEVADEYFIARTQWKKTPPWKKTHNLYYLLPNYLKVAARNLSNRKMFSALNFVGLIIGLFCCSIVALYVNYETSWDSVHEKSDRTYRLGRNYRSQGYSVFSFEQYWQTPRAQQLKQINAIKNIVGIEDAAHFWVDGDDQFVKLDEEEFISNEVLSTNTPKSFFNLFDWTFLLGNVEMANEPYTALLTRSEAEKYFGQDWKEKEIIGKSILTSDTTFQIAGVLEDIPSNSHYEFNLFLHTNTVPYWGGRTYALLEEGANAEDVFQKIDNNMSDINTRLAESELYNGIIYQPIENIHLNSDLLYEMKTPGEVKYLYAFSIISIIILLLTVTNYTNLSIALNSGRMREIGMRKVIGASRSGLMFQFLLESLILSVLAVPVVLMLLNLFIEPFNNFMGVEVSNLFLSNVGYLLILIVSALIVGFLAGIYPAFYLSTKRITNLFNVKSLQAKVKGLTTRKILIAFQFVLLIGLTSFTYLINKQLSYVQNKDVGYNKQGILYTRIDSDDHEAFKQKLKELPQIKRVGRANPIGRSPFNQLTYKLEGQDDIFDDANNFRMTPEAVQAFGIKTSIPELINNPDSLPEEITLINETLVKKFIDLYGLDKPDLIGMQIVNEPEYIGEEGQVGFPHTIHGFYEDINPFSLRENVEPYFLRVNKTFSGGLVVIQFDTGEISTVLENVEKVYSSMDTGSPMWYSFMEENLEELYEKEERVGNLTVYLSLIAFIVAVLGLIALSALLTTMKKKEVGIRKVLGASTFQIIRRFNSEYVKIVGISLLIAAPLTWYGVNKWLQTFAFKIEINPTVFVGAASLTLLIALSAVSIITYQAALDNPASSLKEDQ